MKRLLLIPRPNKISCVKHLIFTFPVLFVYQRNNLKTKFALEQVWRRPRGRERLTNNRKVVGLIPRHQQEGGVIQLWATNWTQTFSEYTSVPHTSGDTTLWKWYWGDWFPFPITSAPCHENNSYGQQATDTKSQWFNSHRPLNPTVKRIMGLPALVSRAG